MVQAIEISSLDLRYADYRLKNAGVEGKLLSSIAESGIKEPVEGVDKDDVKILLNGFKRYRCALKLGINIIPYSSLGTDEAMGIIQLLRISNTRSLSIIEQSRLIDDLRNIHKMSVTEISEYLSRSKSWVSVRLGIIGSMSETVREKIFSGAFPVYSYMYTLRQFIRINSIKSADIDDFVKAVSGKRLSIRDIEQLAYGYFRGPESFKEQIKTGDIGWALTTMRNIPDDPDACNEAERGMLRDLEITQKYMARVINKSGDKRFKNNAFYAQVNLLSSGILSKIQSFTRTLKEIYDRSGQKKSSIPVRTGRRQHK